MNASIRKAVLFIVPTFCVSWLLAILFFVFGGKWNTPSSIYVGVIYMFIPMVMAIVVQKIIYREPLKEPLGISFKLNQWFLVAWLLPPVIAFLHSRD